MRNAPVSLTGGGTLPLLARLIFAVAVMITVLVSWNFYRQYLTANVMSRFGDLHVANPNELAVGMTQIQRAYSINPHDPDIQLRLANAILKQESQKVRAQDFRSIDASNLKRSLSLLREAQKSNLKPHFVQLKFAEAANLAVRYLQMTGQAQLADPYEREAVANLVAFRDQQGVLRDKAETVYALAIDLSTNDPSVALKFWDDYARTFGDDSLKNKDVMMKVMLSYRRMGEINMLSARAANYALQSPDDGDMFNILSDLGTRLNQKPAVLLILTELENQGLLTGRGRAMKTQLLSAAGKTKTDL